MPSVVQTNCESDVVKLRFQSQETGLLVSARHVPILFSGLRDYVERGERRNAGDACVVLLPSLSCCHWCGEHDAVEVCVYQSKGNISVCRDCGADIVTALRREMERRASMYLAHAV